MVLGKKYLHEKCGQNGVVSPEEFKKMMDELFFAKRSFEYRRLYSVDQFFGLSLQGYIKRMKAVSEKLDRFMEQVLDEHNERRRGNHPDYVASDMVDLLLQLANDPFLDVRRKAREEWGQSVYPW